MENKEKNPPATYEELIRVIHDRFDQMSKTYQRIAEYLTQRPNDVAVNSVNAIAAQCDIHASSFVRFAQALGYSGFKDLQALFQARLSTAAPGFEARKKALEGELSLREDHSELGFLRDLVVRDVASLQDLLDKIEAKDMARAADLIEKADNAGAALRLAGCQWWSRDAYGTQHEIGRRAYRRVLPLLCQRSRQYRGGERQGRRPDHRDLRQHIVAADEAFGDSLCCARARLYLLAFARRTDVSGTGVDGGGRRSSAARRRKPTYPDRHQPVGSDIEGPSPHNRRKTFPKIWRLSTSGDRVRA